MIQEHQNKQNKLILYIHGQEGSPEEAEYYRSFFPEWDVYGFDYQSENPWEAKEEFSLMEGGEHWFHTEEHMQFLDQWMQSHCSNSGGQGW